AFRLHDPDPDRDEMPVRVVGPADDEPAALALVEFIRCEAIKIGPPNDEVIHGHPLYGKGLVAYKPLVVVNSRWMQELVNINRVHDRFNVEYWRRQRHFLFAFHDETVEAIAHDVRVET